MRERTLTATPPAATARAHGVVLRATLDQQGVALGRRATLVQLSTRFCAPCRATRRVLERVVETSTGVVHVELDVTEHLELGERLAVVSTPTVIVLDADGAVQARATGVPTLSQVRAVLGDGR